MILNLKTEDLATNAYQKVRDAILHGEFAPGVPLFEVHLATRMGIIRTPLRGTASCRLCRRTHKAEGGEGAPNDAVYRTVTTDLTWFELPWSVFTPNKVGG